MSRIQPEHPCRTLFIRNIEYEINSSNVRRQFEEHGEVKTFFDLISTRGMVVVTYYDLRAAERAREQLQGFEINGQLSPRDDLYSRGASGESQQSHGPGTLQVALRSSASGLPIDDNELRRKLQQFGDVKSVNPVGDRLDQRYVEFYDIRACDEAYDRLRHQSLQDNTMNRRGNSYSDAERGRPTKSIANGNPIQLDGSSGGNQRRDGRYQDGSRESADRGSPRNRGGRRRGKGRSQGYDDDGDYHIDRRDDRDIDRRGGRYDNDYGRHGGRRGRKESTGGNKGGIRYSNGYSKDRNIGGGSSSRGDSDYGPPGPSGPPPVGYDKERTTTIPGGYRQQAPTFVTSSPLVDDRIEQARRVQQLLAALKQPNAGGDPPALLYNSGTSPSSSGFPGVLPLPHPTTGTNNLHPSPPQDSQQRLPFPEILPPPLANDHLHHSVPPSSTTPQPSLPPNLLALLQATQKLQQSQTVKSHKSPPQQQLSLNSTPYMQAGGQSKYAQLMTLLVQNQAAASATK